VGGVTGGRRREIFARHWRHEGSELLSDLTNRMQGSSRKRFDTVYMRRLWGTIVYFKKKTRAACVVLHVHSVYDVRTGSNNRWRE
jgi:hypothetical protein